MNRSVRAGLALGFAVLAAGVIGCNEGPVEPGSTAAFPAPSIDRSTEEGVIRSVRGNGHLVGGDVERTVTFNILEWSDGTVDGWYHSLKRGPGGAHIRVRVECLHVVGNQAWASGTVVDAVDPDNIGRPYSMRFLDNGEGANTPPDEIGVARFAEYDCTTEPDIPLRVLTIGNLQVRD
jgi:hypothetical protein